MIFSEHLIRAVIYFFYIVVIIRFLGKREVGQLGTFDLIFLLLLADIASISIENTEQPIWYFIVIMGILAGIQKLISFIQLKFPAIRRLFDGSPSVIVFKGKVLVTEMKKQLYTIDDLLTQMREKGIKRISDIHVAILETDGQLSTFTIENDFIPLPVIVSGVLVKENLKYLNIDEASVRRLLKKRSIKDIYCAYYYDNHLLTVDTE